MMSKEKMVPRLRFEEFERNWVRRQLKDISIVSQGLQIPIGKRFKRMGRNRYFYLTNEFLKENSKISYYIENPSKSVLCNKDDILMTRTGNTGIVITDVEGAFHNNFFKIDYDKKEINKNFLVKTLESSKVQNDILGKASGSTILDLNHSDFYDLTINIPLLIEQEKIGKFFKKIDKMIQLQQSKVKKTKNIKSAYLSEMFPKEGEKYPKKRFEGFINPWEKRELGSLLSYEQPTDYLVNNDNYDDSYPTPVLTAGKSFLLGYTNETKGIYYADKKNGVIIFDDFTTSSHYVNFNFKVKSSAMKFLTTTNKDFNLYFLYNLLTNINYKPESHERHWISIFAKFDVMVPKSLQEQEKIGNFFKNLDNQISMEEEKLSKLEKLKQAYLNDMFV